MAKDQIIARIEEARDELKALNEETKGAGQPNALPGSLSEINRRKRELAADIASLEAQLDEL